MDITSNKVQWITGNLGREWETKTAGDKRVYQNSIACNSDDETSTWLRVTLWPDDERGLGKWLPITQQTGRGTLIHVKGKITTHSYQQDGEIKTQYRISPYEVSKNITHSKRDRTHIEGTGVISAGLDAHYKARFAANTGIDYDTGYPVDQVDVIVAEFEAENHMNYYTGKLQG